MALTYVYAVSPPGATAAALGPGGVAHPYTPNAAGVITGVTPADALFLNSQGGSGLIKLCCTGLTADRPLPVSTLSSPGVNYVAPMPVLGDIMFDTTLGVPIFYVGTQRSTTGWVNSAGSAV